jgi:hypothetical protein
VGNKYLLLYLRGNAVDNISTENGGDKIHINHILVMVDYWANDAIRYGFSKLAVGE